MGHGRPELRYHAGQRKTLKTCFKKMHSRNRMKLIHNNTTRNVTHLHGRSKKETAYTGYIQRRHFILSEPFQSHIELKRGIVGELFKQANSLYADLTVKVPLVHAHHQ